MNYFEWYELPCSLKIDKAALKQKFYEKSRALHPDFHSFASNQEHLALLESASFNNQAYKTLSDDEALLKYLLIIKEKLAPEGENKVPEEFLFEVMDLNEMVMELQMKYTPETADSLGTAIRNKDQELVSAVGELMEADSVDEFSHDDWSKLTEFYLKRRYLHRLKSNFAKVSEEQ